MKRLLQSSILVMLLFFSLSAIAQLPMSQVGIKIGLNNANIHDDRDINPSDLDFSSVNYFHAGLFLNKYFNDHIGVGAEILFSQKGTQETININTPSPTEANLKLSYLSIPLMLKIRAGNLVAEAGPEFSYRLGLSTDPPILAGILEEIWTEEIDYGLVFGVGYQLKRLNIGVRYNLGLGKLSDITFTDVNGEPLDSGKSFQNRVLQVSVGYALLSK